MSTERMKVISDIVFIALAVIWVVVIAEGMLGR